MTYGGASDMEEVEVHIGRERRTRPVPWPAGQGSKVVIGGHAALVGWSLKETTGAGAAVVRFRNGQDATGTEAGVQQLPSGTSQTIWLGDDGVDCQGGVFLEVVSGSVEGAVYCRW